ncbi:MAG: HEAT repeat domain-containing protein [Acidobacteriota bacterium]
MTANPLVDQILNSGNKQLQQMAAEGLAPLPPEELVPLQIALAGGGDADVARAAATSLGALDPHIGANFLREHADEAQLLYFAAHNRHPTMVEAMMRRRDVPSSVLIALAPHLHDDAQEILLLRQDAIVDEPEILVALESNAALSRYAKRRIWEYREHLLPRDKVPYKSAAEIKAEADTWTDDDVREAIDEVREGGSQTAQRAAALTEGDDKPEDADGAPVKAIDENDDSEFDVTKLNDAQIRALPVPARIKLARGASQQLRSVLIRDTSTQVALATMHSNNLTDQEVEMIAASRAVVFEVLEEIPKKREWIRKYNVVKNLVKNPRTAIATSRKLVSRLSTRDLREIGRDRNVSEAVRSMARRLYTVRQG